MNLSYLDRFNLHAQSDIHYHALSTNTLEHPNKIIVQGLIIERLKFNSLNLRKKLHSFSNLTKFIRDIFHWNSSSALISTRAEVTFQDNLINRDSSK